MADSAQSLGPNEWLVDEMYEQYIADPSSVVWDEVVGFWIVLLLWLPAGWQGQLAAFVLFRVFDAVKRGPVGWADRTFKGAGWRGGFTRRGSGIGISAWAICCFGSMGDG